MGRLSRLLDVLGSRRPVFVPLADIRLENSILRNSIQTRDLAFYRHALDRVQIGDRMAFCWFPGALRS